MPIYFTSALSKILGPYQTLIILTLWTNGWIISYYLILFVLFFFQKYKIKFKKKQKLFFFQVYQIFILFLNYLNYEKQEMAQCN